MDMEEELRIWEVWIVPEKDSSQQANGFSRQLFTDSLAAFYHQTHFSILSLLQFPLANNGYNKCHHCTQASTPPWSLCQHGLGRTSTFMPEEVRLGQKVGYRSALAKHLK